MESYLELTQSFISEISLSISSMKWMTKSINLWRYISSVWKLVIKKLKTSNDVVAGNGKEIGDHETDEKNNCH